MNFSSRLLIFFGLRGLQAVWTIICLGLAAGILSDLDHNFSRASYTVATAVITILYLVFIFLVFLLHWLQPLVALIAEIVLFILWLAAFGVMAESFGSLSCSTIFGSIKWCKMGKALIAFTLLNWLTFGVTLGLLLFFTIVPLYRAGGLKNLFISNNFELGGISSKSIPHAAMTEHEAGEPKPEESVKDHGKSLEEGSGNFAQGTAHGDSVHAADSTIPTVDRTGRTVEPIAEPTMEPTVESTVGPTVGPTVEPTVEPIIQPTVESTVEPINATSRI